MQAAAQGPATMSTLPTIESFLSTVFANASGYIGLWRSAKKTSHYVAAHEPAAGAAWIDAIRGDDDVFVGVATRATDFGPNKRGTAAEVSSLLAFWADIDVVGPAHARKDLPATEADALAFVRSLPLAPSIVVRSGHGLHVWWLFQRPADLTAAQDRSRLAAMSRAFQRGLRVRGREHGWELDDTADLARCLRVPGSWNRKVAPPVLVSIAEMDGAKRYTPDELVAAFEIADDDGDGADDELTDEDVLEAIEAGVEKGARDTMLFRYARILRARGIGKSEIERQVVAAAARCRPPYSERAALAKVASSFKGAAGSGGGKLTELLVECAEGIDLFHDEEVAYARIPLGGHHEVYRVPSRAFADWLTRRLFETHRKAATATPLAAACAVLAMRGKVEGDDRRVNLRVAESDGAIYIDLGDPAWRVVEVSRAGWRVLEDPPVMFRRPNGMRALPEPVRGGSIAELRPFVNLPDDAQWMLFVGYLLACLRTSAPFPVLAVHGPQGSAKSTLVQIARALVDPNQVSLRVPPKKIDDLIVAANRSWLLCFDNVSGISAELSDAFCMIATGGGLSKRVLFTDDEEYLATVKRGIVLNGIEDLLIRHDLADRAVVLSLPAIADAQRRSARMLDEFLVVRPRIFGALLDGLVAALASEARFESVAPISRMRDFTTWGMAASGAFGWNPNDFYAAHRDNRQEATDQANDADVIVGAVRALIDRDGDWYGTASALHRALATVVSDEVVRSRSWPGAPNALVQRLKRAEHGLRALGIVVVLLQRDGATRAKPISIRRVGAPPPPTGAAPPAVPPPFWPSSVPTDPTGPIGGAGTSAPPRLPPVPPPPPPIAPPWGPHMPGLPPVPAVPVAATPHAPTPAPVPPFPVGLPRPPRGGGEDDR
jgi:hypothetical protein